MTGLWLTERNVIEVSGPEAAAFLDRLITVDVSDLPERGSRYGALLSPQGKVQADFIVVRAAEERFLLDTPAVAAAGLLQRLTLFRLRAAITLRNCAQEIGVVAGTSEGLAYADPRPWSQGAAFGQRSFVAHAALAGFAGERFTSERLAYEAARIAAGLPELGAEFAANEIFPHDINMDQMQAVDFRKGCYVGQEVVSRMQHRGSARTRTLIAQFTSDPVTSDPATSALTADGKPIGTPGPVIAGRALALVRVDRWQEALAAGIPVLAGAASVTLTAPDYARFSVQTAQEST